MLLIIDNYDSFTWNLFQFLGEVVAERRGGKGGPEIRVERNDALSVDECLALKPDAIVLSPGPGDPDRAGICLELVERAAADIPMLGVCLGHQAIGQAYGGRVVRAEALMHGKTSPIVHGGLGVFRDLPDPMTATRYHSLTVAPEDLPDALEVTAETADGTIMGLRHKSFPTHGVQFHPESIATQEGRKLLSNFLTLAEIC
ncbi:MAG: aminodeoxychorismate/anthranilate synthase component II [Pseudomonadota bacterium]